MRYDARIIRRFTIEYLVMGIFMLTYPLRYYRLIYMKLFYTIHNLLKFLILLVLLNSCSNNNYQLGKKNYDLKKYSLAKSQFLSVPKYNSFYDSSIIFINKIDSIEDFNIQWGKEQQKIKLAEFDEAKKSILKKFKTTGIFGRWKCTVPVNMECFVTFKEIEGKYYVDLLFPRADYSVTEELMKISDARYEIINHQESMYYVIDKNNNLTIWDVFGKVGSGNSIMP